MKKLMILLLSVFTLYSCKNDVEEVDWTVDTLAITSEGNQLQDAGDGNLKMVLPTEFSGVIKLNVESNNPWIAEVSDITIQEEQWITLSSAEGIGNGTFDINIAPNNSAIDRIGSVVVTTTGNIPVKKTITLIQGNTDDMLSIGFDGVELPTGVTVKEGVSGSWSMVLPIDFSPNAQISVAISSTVNPNIDITYPEGLPTDWLQAVTTLSETSTVTFTVTENTSNEYREALVTFTSKSGEVEVKKTLTVSQLGEEDIIWGGDYFQGSIEDLNNAEIILPSNTLQNVKIADLKNITANNIEIPEEESDWFTVKIEENQVFITTIKENSTTNKENVNELVLKSKLSKEEFKITVRQCMKGYGTILNKKLWNVSIEGCTVSTGEGAGNLKGLYDNQWTQDGTNKKHVQLNKESDNCVIIIDLGENHKEYNAVGLMPRLQWTQPAPGKITVEVRDDNNSGWNMLVNNVNYYTDAELKPDGVNYTGYDGIIKWVKLENQNSRYIKLTMPYSSSFWTGVFCFDEMFVTKLSE